MIQLKSTKINLLLQSWPLGSVATSTWLNSQGVRFDLAERYRRSGWLKTIGKGACIRTGDTVGWQGAVSALQGQLGMLIHPGGKSALNLLGKSHDVSTSSREEITLYSQRDERVPKWFVSNDWDAQITMVHTGLFPSGLQAGFSTLTYGNFTVRVSSAERAIMEMLYSVPAMNTPEQVKKIFEGLITLRPDVVSELLVNCGSRKAKRLFMVLAEMHGHPWLEKLDLSGIDFGKGKRVLVKGGRFDSTYQITVPLNWHTRDSEQHR